VDAKAKGRRGDYRQGEVNLRSVRVSEYSSTADQRGDDIGDPAFASLLFVRPGELRAAEWDEFDVDAKEPVWRIPGAR